DDYHAQQLENKDIVGYGVYGEQTFVAEDITLTPDSSSFIIHTPRGGMEINLELTGIHNVYNAMAAISWCVVEDIEFQYIKDGLRSLDGLHYLKGKTEIEDEIFIQTHKFY